MEATDFVNGIRRSVIDDNLTAYKDLFENSNQASDPYWKEALAFFSSLNVDQRNTLYKIIRQVEVDTVSSVLGILDGTTYVDDEASNFKLLTDEGEQPLNGELQDIFLEMEED